MGLRGYGTKVLHLSDVVLEFICFSIEGCKVCLEGALLELKFGLLLLVLGMVEVEG
jgi:hypothetical protein